MTMNENVRKLLKEQMWYLATYDQEPNAVPVAFKEALIKSTHADLRQKFLLTRKETAGILTDFKVF